ERIAQHVDARPLGLDLLHELRALGVDGVLLGDQLLAALAGLEHALLAGEQIEGQRALARDLGLPRPRGPAAGGAEQSARQPGPDLPDPAQARTSLPNAIRATCSILSTGSIFRFEIRSAGISTRSFSLAAGISTCVTPARRAARIFSLIPPTGKTLPRSVISPVMARSGGTGLSSSRLSSAVTIAMPALGPSFGI